jgi:hypothetical protein
MPRNLAALNAKGFPVPAYAYDSVEQILAVVDRERPDAVLLFSAYLLFINRLLDLDGLAALLAGLRERGIPIATSDPSVGLLGRTDETTFDRGNPGRDWLTLLVPKLFEALKDVPHLYLAPDVATEVRHFAFFNPRIAPQGDAMSRLEAALHQWEPIDAARRRWLFVLSPEDQDVQVATHGWDAFVGSLLDRLGDAVAADRQPILLAPKRAIERVQSSGRRFGNLVALASCNYTHFMRLLYEAESVFYWNTFSASIVARVVARRPFFLFDRGHVVRTMPAFHDVGMRHFYPGCRLAFVDPRAPLDAIALADAAARQASELFDPCLANLARSPSPEEVVAELV